MERFLKFKEDVNLDDLKKSQSDNRILILRKSQTTNTVQIKVPEGMSSKEIKHAFGNLQIVRIYNEFPYPIGSASISRLFVLPLVRLFQKHS